MFIQSEVVNSNTPMSLLINKNLSINISPKNQVIKITSDN